MTVCSICRFETELDDVAIPRIGGCICLRCFARETGAARPMPKALRLGIISVLAACEAA